MEITFALVLSSIISGIVEWSASKTLDLAPQVVERAKKALSLVENTELSAVQQAVVKAVTAARSEIENDLNNSMAEGVAQEMIAWLNSPSLAQVAALKMVYRGEVDADRLRSAYIDLDPARNSEKWRALGSYIEEFIDAIQGHLRSDPVVGPPLRHAQIHASLKSIEVYSKSSAASNDLIAQNISQIKLDTQQQTIYMAQTPMMMERLLQRLERPLLVTVVTPTPSLSALTTEERSYLVQLRKDCNKLPLAKQSEDPQAKRAELANVYIDLQIDRSPSLEQFIKRLALPEIKQGELLAALQSRLESNALRTFKESDNRTEINHTPITFAGEGWEEFWKTWEIEESQVEEAQSLLKTLEQVRDQPHFVLLGNPGSGKSTLVNHLAYLFAGALLGEEEHWRQATEDCFDRPLFPLRLILRKWSASLDPDSHEQDPLERVYDALLALPGKMNKETLLRRLEREDTLVFFDGLDETPTNEGDPTVMDRRRLILESIETFRSVHKNCRVVATSRVKPYRETAYQLEHIDVCELQKLDWQRIEHFVSRWYDELIRVEQQESLYQIRRQQLLSALQRSSLQGKRLNEMAQTPLLLTMLAIVNAENVLPENRTELYGKCVEQLLWKWEQAKRNDSNNVVESLAALLLETGNSHSTTDVEEILWKITFDAHAKSGIDQTAEIDVETVRDALRPLYPTSKWRQDAWTGRMVELMRQRSGLFVDNDDKAFTFSHRSFQEYWAARYLQSQPNILELTRFHGGSDIWREVILLACGHSKFSKHRHLVRGMVEELIRRYGDSNEDRQRLLVAGQAWNEYQYDGREEDIATHEKVMPLLRDLMQNKKAPAAQRLEAGLIAADLGDLPEELNDWVEIDATHQLGYAYKLARFLLTNHQFTQFIKEGGYDRNQPWWTCRPEAVAEIEKYRGEWPQVPVYWTDSIYNRKSQPVVGISWYEACAYCDWLNQNKARFAIAENEIARLPTKKEWLSAAAGADERTYPWGKRFDKSKLNSAESGLNQPSPVHMFPEGCTPDTKLWDMAGNVWEWTSSNHEEYDYAKIVIGGSSWNDKDRCHCKPSASDWYHPRQAPLYRLSGGGRPHLSWFCILSAES